MKFIYGSKLLDLFNQHYSDYLLLKSGLLTSYVSSLRQAFEDAGPLHNLSIRHGILNSAQKATARAYVKPEFLLPLQAVERAAPSLKLLEQLQKWITRNQLLDILSSLKLLSGLASLCTDECCTDLMPRATAEALEAELVALSVDLDHKWRRAFEMEMKKFNSKVGHRQVVRLRLDNPAVMSMLASSPIQQCSDLLNRIVRLGSEARDACTIIDAPDEILKSSMYVKYCLVREITISAPSLLQRTEPSNIYSLPETILDNHDGSIMISGPPGYGKTSFCKWSALHEGERFANKEANVIPVYVQLHRISERQLTDFNSAFLNHEHLAEILNSPTIRAAATKIRFYLDGLDEVPIETQRRIMELARQAGSARPDCQFIVTAREHVTGPWLSWLARIHLAPLSDVKIRQLIEQLLNNEHSKINAFYTQLATVPGLKPLLRIPLLCTLTTSVFEGSGSLPETKAELYRIFVDLLCGGWDIAKGIKRRSEFGATVKLRFLINLAAHFHLRKRRSLRSDEMRQQVLKSGFVHLSAWEALVSDIVQDGLLTRDGNSYAFSHLSFQEYLCAKDAADPQSERDRIDKIIGVFLEGDEWWREVILFYAAMSNKPVQMLSRVRTAVAERDAAKAEQRGDDLCSLITEMFPAIGPIGGSKTPSTEAGYHPRPLAASTRLTTPETPAFASQSSRSSGNRWQHAIGDAEPGA